MPKGILWRYVARGLTHGCLREKDLAVDGHRIDVDPVRAWRQLDPNELAFQVFQEAIGDARPPEPEREKNPATVALGRLGGAKGGATRAANMTPEERAESARTAARARWKREKAPKTDTPPTEK